MSVSSQELQQVFTEETQPVIPERLAAHYLGAAQDSDRKVHEDTFGQAVHCVQPSYQQGECACAGIHFSFPLGCPEVHGGMERGWDVQDYKVSFSFFILFKFSTVKFFNISSICSILYLGLVCSLLWLGLWHC